MKIVTIIENNPIFGPKYGVVEISDTQSAQDLRKNIEHANKIKNNVQYKMINNHRTTNK